jgi:hypothetical protein
MPVDVINLFSNFADEKEQEMQIGFPTDVKHVAHIGCDGPSATSAPSWVCQKVSFTLPLKIVVIHENDLGCLCSYR